VHTHTLQVRRRALDRVIYRLNDCIVHVDVSDMTASVCGISISEFNTQFQVKVTIRDSPLAKCHYTRAGE
jgi:hypothetical protein